MRKRVMSQTERSDYGPKAGLSRADYDRMSDGAPDDFIEEPTAPHEGIADDPAMLAMWQRMSRHAERASDRDRGIQQVANQILTVASQLGDHKGLGWKDLKLVGAMVAALLGGGGYLSYDRAAELEDRIDVIERQLADESDRREQIDAKLDTILRLIGADKRGADGER